MNKRKIVLIIILILLLALFGWLIYSVKTNTPQRTVSKVLSLRNDNNISEGELAKYFTEDYKKVEKRARVKLNTSQYSLSKAYKTEEGVRVVLSIQFRDEDAGEVVDDEAAVFYLKRSGFFPFRFGYKINFVEEINPTLTVTFPELVPKKEVSESALGEVVSMDGYKLQFSDYRTEKEDEPEDGSYEGEDIYYISFQVEEINNKNLGDASLFFEAGSSDKLCAQLQGSQDKLDGSKARIKLLAESSGDCSADYLTLKGNFEKDYKVNLK